MKCPSCIQRMWTEDSLSDHWESFHQTSEGDLVEESFGCPDCGELRMSLLDLVLPHMEKVQCLTCNGTYEP